MANKVLMPGFGGTQTQVVAGGGTGPDQIDCVRIALLVFQTTAHTTDATTITIEETYDGTNWATLTTFSSTAGTIKKLAQSSGPFGVIRVKADGTTGSNTITIVGLPLAFGL